VTGAVIDEAAVAGRRAEDDTAETRLTIGATQGCERLEQRVTRYATGRSRWRAAGDREHVLFVVSGAGRLDLDGHPHALAANTGVYVAPGERYEVDNDGPEELVVVEVTVPGPADPGPAPGRQVTVRLDDQPVHWAGERQFRLLVDTPVGCRGATQFVGEIPTGHAPPHSHSYDEVVYVIAGEGAVHMADIEEPIGPGSCVYLPPQLLHCLENTGEATLRVLGVIQPAGDPGSKAAVSGR
jgi:mannose-6-phosphate isomerase-like protein (cupin superfamily)